MTELKRKDSQQRFDLALGRRGKAKGSFNAALCVEIKETAKANLSKSEVLKRVEGDIAKLSEYRDESAVMDYQARDFRLAIVFFFRDPEWDEASAKANAKVFADLKAKHNKDILWLWGPKTRQTED